MPASPPSPAPELIGDHPTPEALRERAAGCQARSLVDDPAKVARELSG